MIWPKTRERRYLSRRHQTPVPPALRSVCTLSTTRYTPTPRRSSCFRPRLSIPQSSFLNISRLRSPTALSIHPHP